MRMKHLVYAVVMASLCGCHPRVAKNTPPPSLPLIEDVKSRMDHLTRGMSDDEVLATLGLKDVEAIMHQLSGLHSGDTWQYNFPGYYIQFRVEYRRGQGAGLINARLLEDKTRRVVKEVLTQPRPEPYR